MVRMVRVKRKRGSLGQWVGVLWSGFANGVPA